MGKSGAARRTRPPRQRQVALRCRVNANARRCGVLRAVRVERADCSPGAPDRLRRLAPAIALRQAPRAHVDVLSSQTPADPAPSGAADAAETGPPLADPPPDAAASPHGAVIGPAIRLWVGHLVPLTLLSALALSPLLVLALRVHAPADPAGSRPVIQLAWTLLAVAWLGQFLLVGGAAAMLTHPPSQLRALTRGLLQLIRAALPCLVAALAVAIGSLALVLPGLVLLVLLSLTAASRERGLPAPLLDSLSAARRQLPAVALAVLALFALDAAIGLIAYRAVLVPLPAKATPAQLATVRTFVRAIALALVILSPLPASVLAALHARAARPRQRERKAMGGPDER